MINVGQRRTPKGRHIMVWGLLLCLFGGVCWRLADLQVIREEFLQEQGDKRAIRTLPIRAYRGMILDRNGEPLAISTPVQSVWAKPSDLPEDPLELASVCKVLDLDLQDVITKILDKKNKSFIYLKRQVPPPIAEKVLSLKVPGVYLQQEYKRYYPNGEVTAHLIGTTNVDQHGQEGIELSYDAVLAGTPGKKIIRADRKGHQIETIRTASNAVAGQDVQLSIDDRIQYLAYRELLSAVNKSGAKSGTMVVLDAQSSELLAMVNVPSYNPNLPFQGQNVGVRNRAVTDQFEPGSLMKPFTIANVLKNGLATPTTVVNTNPGFMMIGSKTVRDVKNFGVLDVSTVIKKSSNVGIAKLILPLPPKSLYNTFNDFGFTKKTDSFFPGEMAGYVRPEGKRDPFALATLGFGYGIAATPLQIAQAYAILASSGVKRPISFMKLNKVKPGEPVISSEIAEAVTKMLISTTDPDGTAYRARVPGYLVAGKTGTARKVGKGGYNEDSHIAMFAGFAPADQPKIVIAMVIDDPSGDHYYGGQICAPVFSKVMEGALRILRVAPVSQVKPEQLMVNK